jgi:hypothetical protein
MAGQAVEAPTAVQGAIAGFALLPRAFSETNGVQQGASVRRDGVGAFRVRIDSCLLVSEGWVDQWACGNKQEA